MYDYDELLKKYALSDSNYQQWRREHTKIFGEIFSSAFEDSVEAQIDLTAALINISKRGFESAFPKLEALENVCNTEFDRAVVYYFLGLNYELVGNEEKMYEYYDGLIKSSVSFVFPIQFHPYYRTAKFAQRESECSKAIYYYRKALSFYDGRAIDEKIRASASQIIYDLATIYLYMHEYDECERFLKLSEEYNPDEDQQRNYVKAILLAAENKFSECYSVAEGMNRFYREYLDPMLDAINNHADLHYCVCLQDRSKHIEFWNWLAINKSEFEKLLIDGCDKLSDVISKKITELFSFMKRRLYCRIERNENSVTVYLKNYSVKTLISEYEALISEKPEMLSNWKFESVNWFENYS